MTQRKKVAQKKKATRPGRPRLTPEAVAAERARSMSGAGRRGLFWKAPSKNGKAIAFKQEMRFLPAYDYRGPEEDDEVAVRPFFFIGQHWIRRTNDDGEEYGAGITCSNFMREEQPRAWQRYRDEKIEVAIENKPCLFCDVLEALSSEDEDGDKEWDPDLPEGAFGSDPAWIRRYSHNFAVLLPQTDYAEDDDQIVKIYAAPRSVKDGLYNYLDKKQFMNLFEETGGWWVEVNRFRKGRGPWEYSITPSEADDEIWYTDWESELPDLEMISPNWMTQKEILEWLEEGHPEVYAKAVDLLELSPAKKAKPKASPAGRRKQPAAKKKGARSKKTRER